MSPADDVGTERSAKRIVVKYGGTSLGSGELIRKAAESIKGELEKGIQVAVVVSAMDETTDDLVKLAKVSIDRKANAKDLDSIVAFDR